MTTSFDGQMAMSDEKPIRGAIETFIRSYLPGVAKIERASQVDDKLGTDYWATQNSGKKISVDVKIRDEDFVMKDPPQDDLALEVWSVVGVKVGWTRDENKLTDYVLWHWLDSGRCCMLPFPFLNSVFQENYELWLTKYQENLRTQTTVNPDQTSYRSTCIFIPRKVVVGAINDRFYGKLAASGTDGSPLITPAAESSPAPCP